MLIYYFYNNLDFRVIRQLYIHINAKLLSTNPQIVKSNVAISSAITAYARIEMICFANIKR